ncbi:hypothetical protein [Lutispora thermophila]|uniref:GNAT family N-acetyltransferase n=1 Tax=Lutispora thermophila DSM 19022 TaxID=1122184 RepID=A0A1M6GY60_9FIRM|nr:hypothetical protein [Lutispora thermophila]SHJ14862.1 hypothetical protein SAMN02745176_02579 [Lutispora thermophila DSM 19022]
MRIHKDNIVIKSANIDDALQYYQNKGYGPRIINMLFDFLFTDEIINSACPIKRIAWDNA